MTEKITADQAIEALEAAVELRGEDYIYLPPSNSHTCLYVHDRDSEQPEVGCGVGMAHYLLRDELVPEFAEGMDPHGIGPHVYMDSTTEAVAWWSKHYTDEALEVLTVFQQGQDDSRPWGEALDAARRVRQLQRVEVKN